KRFVISKRHSGPPNKPWPPLTTRYGGVRSKKPQCGFAGGRWGPEGGRKALIFNLLENNALDNKTTSARGEKGCGRHNEGKGPFPAHRSIIFDVFPRSAASRYFADMSRTVVRGTPSPELKKLYQIVHDAQEEAITKIRDGADGMKIHRGICERFEKAGYKT